MDEPTDTFEVPADVLADMRTAAPLLSEALSRAAGRRLDVDVIEADVEGFGVAEAAMALLSIPVAGLGLLSKKWIEEVVWPELKPRLTGPTHELLDYLFSLVPAAAKEPPHG
jgi:hypothetical protein